MEGKECIRVFADVNQINQCKTNLVDVNQSISLLSSALNLAGNEVRLKILFLLYKERKLCVCDISDILEMKIPAVSQHLRKMKDGGVISNHKTGQTVFYFVNSEYETLFQGFFKKISNNNILVQ